MGGAFALLARIGMPAGMREKITDVQGVEGIARRLHDVAAFEDAANELHAALAPDTDGSKILSVMLREAAASEEEYRRRAIPATVYLATMAAFSRFVLERRRGYGDWAFDRWWWTGRQISLKLFRIGLLEYELCEEGGRRSVSVHIPSDMPLSDDAVDASLTEAQAFMRRYFPQFADVPYTCHSWLLSPVLEELLPPSSRILRFAARFDRKEIFWDSEDYRFFVFGRQDIAPEEFAEGTTLQRALKAHVLGGGKVGAAYGVLKGLPK